MSHAPNPEYPANLREFVRQLGERGRSPYAIRNQLLARGYDPAPAESTILRWIDADYAEVDRLRGRKFGTPGPGRAKAWEARLDRMKALRGARVGFRAIAAVMMLDCPDLQLNENQVRGILAGRTSLQTARQLLAPGVTDEPRTGRPPKASKVSA